MLNLSNPLFLLRISVALILIMHSIPGMFNNGVNDFGNFYLNAIGFAPVGVPFAWALKLSHVAAAVCFIIDKYVKPAGIITIAILIMGIVMVHFPEGWFVVGGGRNGMEFNVLLIGVILTIMFPKGLRSKSLSN
jgi:putative oxidoreductase